MSVYPKSKQGYWHIKGKWIWKMTVSLLPINISFQGFWGEKVTGYIYQRCNWIFFDQFINHDLKHRAAIL